LLSRAAPGCFFAAIPIGLLLSLAIQTRPASSVGSDSSIRSVSAETILRLEDEQRSLKDSIKSLRAQVDAAQKDTSNRRTQLSGLSSDIEAQKMAAGFTAVRGPGVRVTLDDSQSKNIPVGTDPNQLIVHDYDLRDTVSLLWANGAEAIAINGQRLVANTSIYCVGSTILVNDTRLSPPYVVEAIGPQRMQAAANEPSAMERFKSLSKKFGLGFATSWLEDLTVPAFDGHLTTRYASGQGS